jgi:transposase InsO family protein
MIVKPETIVRWHRAGFRLYWCFPSGHNENGRPRISSELRQLIERMAKENPTWGAPRIYGELLKLGLEISERTVSRHLARVGCKGDALKLWLIFLRNHREVIAAMDFFTVPTATFRVLYCFFVISLSRRKVLRFNATEHPSSRWIAKRLREAFPEDTAPRCPILDQDRKYGGEATQVLQSMSSELIRTSYQSPWQNGVAERWVGSCRRELLDYVIVFNEAHLRRLVREYLGYYHADRIHDGLGKDTPQLKAGREKGSGSWRACSSASGGWLHHRYAWGIAA